ncbi:amidohydrolase [Achromobacter aloeverae]|uniref:Peptidase M20 n=1 Tax=Achromobacter aloeverae TaxID=1750518 RepID=A0A4Q1HJD6_9BURK|nr:amidohydrolase [Achromobacter aloeverae]RXN87813.1 peptidase M20 [Achromobacter aloeverae]
MQTIQTNGRPLTVDPNPTAVDLIAADTIRAATLTNDSLTAELSLPLAQQVVATRRDLHRHAEPGWCEYRTAAKVVATLRALGWEVRHGRAVTDTASRLGVPPTAELQRHEARAASLGIDPDVLAAMRDGHTGVVGVLRGTPGPVAALRFDMDANTCGEDRDAGHPPMRDGYASINDGIHHNCGHDGHTAIGLALARLLAEQRDAIRGEIRLVFQPAEEGLRGAAAMVAAGVMDGVDVFFGCHIGVQALRLGEIVAGYRNILASLKLDATFQGVSAHAAISPQVGRNALLAACVATQNLHALPRHGDGETRVNVGLLSGGEARNAVAAHATLAAEIRADSSAVLDTLHERAMDVLDGAARMHGVQLSTRVAGACGAASSDEALAEQVAQAAASVAGITHIRASADFKGSDDAAAMMAAVQQRGGQAVYIGLGSPLRHVHHHPSFDFDEAVLPLGVALFEAVLRQGGHVG